MYIKTTGLVLRETEYKESSRILTVLTPEGKLTVSARGAKRRGSGNTASTQLFAYSDMTLFSQKGRCTLQEARSLELFLGLRDDVALLALGSYFAELLDALSDEDSPSPELLSLGLNALFALGESKRPPALVKAAFELRLMCAAGFEPALDCCAVCGREEPEQPVLALSGGVLRCAACRGDAEPGGSAPLSKGVLDAMRYIARCDIKKLCSFSAGEETIRSLGSVCESYLLAQMGGSFGTLDFYRSVAADERTGPEI